MIGIGLVRRAKRKALSGEHILSIYFHKPTAREFEDCLLWLKGNGFVFLSTANIYGIAKQEEPFPKGGVVLTVDDGWISNETCIADIADKYGVPVTIFVSTGPVEQGNYWWSYIEEGNKRRISKLSIDDLKHVANSDRLAMVERLKRRISLPREAMTKEQVQKISTSPYITIGAHTVTHPILNNCPDKQVFEELSQSKRKLEQWIGKDVEFFAYPNGDYTAREILILYQQSYKLAFTVHPEFLKPEKLKYTYELPRFEVIEGAPFAEAICRMVGIWEPFMNNVRRLMTSDRANPRPNLQEQDIRKLYGKSKLGYLKPSTKSGISDALFLTIMYIFYKLPDTCRNLYAILLVEEN
ncbi:polysaccharide deacetylase family protein [Pontibacter oryzae]|nr:polysaccharide deacetylase family protein [Pontibacter oryzae]